MTRSLFYWVSRYDLRFGCMAVSSDAHHQNVGQGPSGHRRLRPRFVFRDNAVKETPHHRGIRRAVYRFASEENAEIHSQPAKYATAYGGWCATSMAEGKKVEIRSINYKSTDGRLFLSYKSISTMRERPG